MEIAFSLCKTSWLTIPIDAKPRKCFCCSREGKDKETNGSFVCLVKHLVKSWGAMQKLRSVSQLRRWMTSLPFAGGPQGHVAGPVAALCPWIRFFAGTPGLFVPLRDSDWSQSSDWSSAAALTWGRCLGTSVQNSWHKQMFSQSAGLVFHWQLREPAPEMCFECVFWLLSYWHLCYSNCKRS